MPLPIILGLSLAFTVTVVDPLVLSLNLPQVDRALHVPPQLVGLLGGAATLVMAASVLAAGSLGDTFGLKRLLMLGLTVVTVVNLLSVFSPGYGFLLAMRFLDGLGMTALLGVPLALLKVSVPAEQRPTAIGVLMAVEMVLCGVIPAFTGWAVAAVGWRFLFLIAPLLSLVSLWLTARYVPKSPVQQGRRLDVAGVSLIGLVLVTLVVGLGAAQNGVARPQTWVPLVISAVAAVLYVLHARRTAQPALDLALFRSSPFSVALAAAVTLNFLGVGLSLVLGQFGSVVLSLSPEKIGLLYLPGTLLVAGAVILAGRLVGKYTPRPVMVTGLLTMAASGLLLAGTASPTMALWLLVLATWLCNLGALVTSTSVSETVLSQAPPGHSGTVASVQMAFAMTGSALGPTVYLLLFNFFFQRQWLADAAARDLSVGEAQQAVDAVSSGMAQSPGGNVYDPNLLRQASGLRLGLDFTEALQRTMLIVSILPLVVAGLALALMPRRENPGRRARSGPRRRR
ncbi:MFS transporter [Streptomyces pluripotens]|uniref:MFS transporter n=1 Tax=Streptomyces pluripotens TaxID=1355015 RepID=A0A221P8Q6_9ACTN|nr:MULTISPECIES: MFS transporter [Streptomyces]ARP74325.1 MFS transporter [Streptomyces pluripotens]ASN28600.1 MFS transporter [Streptomyces pluripotens]MCH0560739.1 MFS transporter [Streptomyces sp. MUM 16J]